jgi:hypothetical protein
MTTDDLKAVFDGNSQTNDPNEFTLNYTRRVPRFGPNGITHDSLPDDNSTIAVRVFTSPFA